MYNTKFILVDSKEIYPGYLDMERREALKEQYKNKKEFMWCGCRSDLKLFYKISEDLRIYPEHNNYEHGCHCSRYRTASGEQVRRTAYVVDEENGQVTTFLTFNPKNFNLNDSTEKDQDNPSLDDDVEESESELVLEKDEVLTSKEEKKEPQLSLGSLIRSINVDTFTEKVLNNRKIESKELFSRYVYHRMKQVRVSRMKKMLGDLSLEADGVRFVYLSLAGIIEKQDKGLTRCYIQNYGLDGKVFNNFIFPDTVRKAIKEFVKTYKMEPNKDTMMAGFQYYKKTKSKTAYKVMGRVHLFQVSNLGVYCRSLIEKEAFDSIHKICSENDDLKFWISPEDDSNGGIIQVKNKRKKILLIFRSKKNEYISYDSSIYEPLVIGTNEPFTEEGLQSIIESLE